MKEVALHQQGTACLLREHEQWQLRAIAVSRHENNQEEKNTQCLRICATKLQTRLDMQKSFYDTHFTQKLNSLHAGGN